MKRSSAWAFGLRLAVLGAASAVLAETVAAQAAAGGALQQRLAAVKEAAAANQAALRQYTWSENVQFSLNGEVKGNKQMSCRYGPDGKPQCVPTGPQQPQQQQGGLRGRIAEKKKEEMTDYMQQVKGVIGLYVPPDGARLQAAHAAGNTSLSAAGAGEAALVVKNYSMPGDSMTLDFAMAARKLAALSVNTYLGDASSPITLSVKFAQLPDGTNYPAQEVINAPAKGIQLTVTNSNYQKLPS
jgi:hypothetical protein